MNTKEKIKCLIWNASHFNKIIRKKGLRINDGNAMLSHCCIINTGKENELSIAPRSDLRQCKFHFYGSHNQIIIEEGTCLNNLEIWIEDDYNCVKIGKYTSVTGQTHLACTEGCQIIIGENCLFSSNIVIRTGDSHSIVNEQGQRINHAESVLVKDHVWIGQNATILKGTMIENDSIVGTGSVLTGKKFGPNVIVAGVPASVVKKNVNWNKKRI